MKAELEAIKSEGSGSEAEIAQLNSQISKLNSKIEELNATISEKDALLGSQKAHLDEVESELGELKPPEISSGGFVSEERITCPMCGSVGSDIKSVEDKSKVLSYVGHIPMYAKKNVCKKCGYEF